MIKSQFNVWTTGKIEQQKQQKVANEQSIKQGEGDDVKYENDNNNTTIIVSCISFLRNFKNLIVSCKLNCTLGCCGDKS